MSIPVKFLMRLLAGCLAVSALASCAATRTAESDETMIPETWETGQSKAGFTRILNPRVYAVNTPVAGNYPQSMFRYPYRAESKAAVNENFTQTLEWLPAVSKTFAVNTVYTAKITLEPKNANTTFRSTPQNSVRGLPQDGVRRITAKIRDESLVIYIVFEETAGENAAPQIVFEDEFEGTSLDKGKWETTPEWDRQGHSTWKDDMVEVRGGNLIIKFKKDPELGAAVSGNYSQAVRNSWIRAGGIRTRKKNWEGDGFPILWENTYGYYEARIKYPRLNGIWGAFWLMTPNMPDTAAGGRYATEIDIVEFAGAANGHFSSALHWDGYGSAHKSSGSGTITSPDIYDGEFHTFALDWSPSEYVFLVDGREFWRTDGSANNGGICGNPLYIKLTVESNFNDQYWAGLLPADFTEGEMLVDWVRVWNQPPQ